MNNMNRKKAQKVRRGHKTGFGLAGYKCRTSQEANFGAVVKNKILKRYKHRLRIFERL
jgi:hypothetical protein